MKSFCKTILCCITFGLFVCLLVDNTPLFGPGCNPKVLNFSLAAIAVVSYIALMASIIGLVASIVLLFLEKYRDQGVVYLLLTLITSVIFLFACLVLPLTLVFKIDHVEKKCTLIYTKVLLYDPSMPSQGVAIFEASADQQNINYLTGTCKMKNVIGNLQLAKYVTFEEDTDKGIFLMTIHSVQIDGIPYYPIQKGILPEGGCHSHSRLITDSGLMPLRINGELMTLAEATSRFRRVPPPLIGGHDVLHFGVTHEK